MAAAPFDYRVRSPAEPLSPTPDNGDGDPVLAHEGVVTTSVGSTSALGLEPRRLRVRAEPLATRPSRPTLRERILDTTEPERMLEIAEASLAASLRPGVAGVQRCAAAVSMLESDPTCRPRSYEAAG